MEARLGGRAMTVLGFWDVVAKVIAVVFLLGLAASAVCVAWTGVVYYRRRLRVWLRARGRRGWLDGRARL